MQKQHFSLLLGSKEPTEKMSLVQTYGNISQRNQKQGLIKFSFKFFLLHTEAIKDFINNW